MVGSEVWALLLGYKRQKMKSFHWFVNHKRCQNLNIYLLIIIDYPVQKSHLSLEYSSDLLLQKSRILLQMLDMTSEVCEHLEPSRTEEKLPKRTACLAPRELGTLKTSSIFSLSMVL